MKSVTSSFKFFLLIYINCKFLDVFQKFEIQFENIVFRDMLPRIKLHQSDLET